MVCHAGAPPTPSSNGAAPVVEGYQLPPQEIVDIIDAPLQPLLSFSPDRTQASEGKRAKSLHMFCRNGSRADADDVALDADPANGQAAAAPADHGAGAP